IRYRPFDKTLRNKATSDDPWSMEKNYWITPMQMYLDHLRCTFVVVPFLCLQLIWLSKLLESKDHYHYNANILAEGSLLVSCAIVVDLVIVVRCLFGQDTLSFHYTHRKSDVGKDNDNSQSISIDDFEIINAKAAASPFHHPPPPPLSLPSHLAHMFHDLPKSTSVVVGVDASQPQQQQQSHRQKGVARDSTKEVNNSTAKLPMDYTGSAFWIHSIGFICYRFAEVCLFVCLLFFFGNSNINNSTKKKKGDKCSMRSDTVVHCNWIFSMYLLDLAPHDILAESRNCIRANDGDGWWLRDCVLHQSENTLS
ncbi:hypothetical protein RFI_17585, partial [Reticulomyxa filosa]